MLENPSTPKIDPSAIRSVIERTAKRTNPRYKQAVERRKVNSWPDRQAKVFRQMRKQMSVERYKQVQQAYFESHLFQQRKFIEGMEKAYHERERTA